MGRLMGLDIGDKRIGVAVSDPTMLIAQGVETYARTGSDRRDISYLGKLARSMGVDMFIAGLPANMDGSLGSQARLAGEFARKLARRTGIPVRYEDERLTSVEAEEILLEAGVGRMKRKAVVDKMAAARILQRYLDDNAHLLRKNAEESNNG